MTRGTLLKLAREKNLLVNNTDDPQQGPHTDVKIVTLHEHAHNLAVREAIETRNQDNPPDLNLIGATDEVEELLDTKYNTMFEFVAIKEDHILIGVDHITIDKKAVNYGLSLLLLMPNLSMGQYCTFGDEVLLRKT